MRAGAISRTQSSGADPMPCLQGKAHGATLPPVVPCADLSRFRDRPDPPLVLSAASTEVPVCYPVRRDLADFPVDCAMQPAPGAEHSPRLTPPQSFFSVMA